MDAIGDAPGVGWDTYRRGLLQQLADTGHNPDMLTRIDGGFCVKRIDSDFCIDVQNMMFNWRVALCRNPEGSDHDRPNLFDFWYVRSYCYFGHGIDDEGRLRTKADAFMRAVLAALTWDGQGDPVGFDKQAL